MNPEIEKRVKDGLHIPSDSSLNAEELRGGLSGAEVYRVNAENSQYNPFKGYYIVKVCPSDERIGGEQQTAYDLWQTAPQFRSRMVQVKFADNVGEKTVIAYSQAQESVTNTKEVSSLDEDSKERYGEIISYELLNLLNKECKQEWATVGSLLKDFLAKQISGRFRERMEQTLDNPEKRWILWGEELYPNPFYFIQHPQEWEGAQHQFWKGISHGDLHAMNILASKGTAQTDYSIIDYDSASLSAWLFFDQAYYEFSVIYDAVHDYDLNQWQNMLQRVMTPLFWEDAEPYGDSLNAKVRNGVCKGINSWMSENSLNGAREWIAQQFISARIAVAINFLCKRSCDHPGKRRFAVLYAAFCLKRLFTLLGDSPAVDPDMTQFRKDGDTENAQSARRKELWEGFLEFHNLYEYVLVTDAGDMPSPEDAKAFFPEINWSLVVDISVERTTQQPLSAYFISRTKAVKMVDRDEKIETYSNTLNILLMQRPEQVEYRRWYKNKTYKNMGKLKSAVTLLLNTTRKRPIIFVFDCGESSGAFRDEFVKDLFAREDIPSLSRFIALRTPFKQEVEEEYYDTFDETNTRPPSSYAGLGLPDVISVCRQYFGASPELKPSIKIPTKNPDYQITKADIKRFQTTFELIYPGYEKDSESSEQWDSRGESFYKGNEATWRDIAEGRAILPIPSHEYENRLENLKQLAAENSSRIIQRTLSHAAGAGGTTLSKKILWDMKEVIPCVRLTRYTPSTVKLLQEIGRGTSNRVLLAVEFGSTVITEDNLGTLIDEMGQDNVDLLILRVMREAALSQNNLEIGASSASGNRILFRLGDTLRLDVAGEFFDKYQSFARTRTNAERRIEMLGKITSESAYERQRSPFFYGFYAFEEEYNLIEHLSATVQNYKDDAAPNALLNCLAFMTCYSQNIGLFENEIEEILSRETDRKISIHEAREQYRDIFKLTVLHTQSPNNTIRRICHELIAKQILTVLHSSDAVEMSRLEIDPDRGVVYKAAEKFIETMSDLYPDGEYDDINDMFRELFIDRVNTPDETHYFSRLLEILSWSQKKRLLELLIEKYPQNPHYYNHLSRVLILGDTGSTSSSGRNGFGRERAKNPTEAVKYAEKAVEKSLDLGENASIHYTNLGWVYGRKIWEEIWEESRAPIDSYRPSYGMLIDSFRGDYNKANQAFQSARDNKTRSDSYDYFPQIRMECDIILSLEKYDRDKRNRKRLIQDEPNFADWYFTHFEKADGLLSEMRETLGREDPFYQSAEDRLKNISLQFDEQELYKRLRQSMNARQTGGPDFKRGRWLVYSFYNWHSRNWDNMEPATLRLAESCFRSSIKNGSGDTNINCLTWFELFRRMEEFDAEEAYDMLDQYLDSGYRKEYLLFLLSFLRYKNRDGTQKSTVEDHKKKTKEETQNSKNTATLHDIFAHPSRVCGCPIIPIPADLESATTRDSQFFEEFTGRVIEVGEKIGEIYLDGLGQIVKFVPRPDQFRGQPERLFTREDVDNETRVRFNLAFSYSGLRAWNVHRLPTT